MRTSRISIFLLLVSTLMGCGTLETKTILLNVGDSKERVLEIMGTPQDRQLRGQQEAWQYCISGAGFGYNDYRTIWFNAGRVTGITSYKNSVTGCAGGFRTVNWESAPDSVLEIRTR